MSYYMVYQVDLSDREDIFHIKADNRYQAYETFITYFLKIHDNYKYYLEDIYNELIMNFIPDENIFELRKKRIDEMEKFVEKFNETPGNLAFMEPINCVFEDEKEEVIIKIKEFFGDQENFAYMFIRYAIYNEQITFSDEMIDYILLNDEELTSDWIIEEIRFT